MWITKNGTAVSSDPTSRPYLAMSRLCRKPAHAVSSQTLPTSTPIRNTLITYGRSRPAQPPAGVCSVPVIAATASVNAGMAVVNTMNRPKPIRHRTAPLNSRRTPARPPVQAEIKVAPPSRKTSSSSRPGLRSCPAASRANWIGQVRPMPIARNAPAGLRRAKSRTGVGRRVAPVDERVTGSAFVVMPSTVPTCGGRVVGRHAEPGRRPPGRRPGILAADRAARGRPRGVRPQADAIRLCHGYGDGMDIAGRVRTGWRSVDRRILDAGASALLFAFMVFELVGNQVMTGENASGAIAYLLAALVTLPFALHRGHPMTVLAICTWATVVYSLGRFSAFPGYALFVLLFGVSLHSDRRRSAVALGAVVAAMSVALILQPAGVVTGSTWISTLLAVAVAWL